MLPTAIIEIFLSDFIFAYRQEHSSYHNLIDLIET